MTAPLGPAPSAPPGGDLGARTWEAPEHEGSPASARSQVAAAAAVSTAVLLVGAASPEIFGWTVAMVVGLLVGIGVGLALPPLRLFDRISGLVGSLITLGASMVLLMFLWAAVQVELPAGCIPVLAIAVLGLDWRRADRLRPVVTAAAAFTLIAALGKEPWIVAAAIVWLAAAFGTYTLLEGDRRAALPRVQPDARAGAGEARADDLATTLLVAAAVALLAALVLSVPSCQRRLDPPDAPDASELADRGEGSGSEGFDPSSGSGGSAERRYVPDPDGRFLVPDDGTGSGSGSGERIPSPQDVPGGLEPGAPRSETLSDGTRLTYERQDDGDVRVTVEDPDGTVTEWRFHERSDGLVEVDRLDPDGSVDRRWYYDPDGQLATGGEAGSGEASGGGSDPAADAPPPDEPDQRPSFTGALQVLGILVVLGLLAWLAVWWWRRRSPDGPAVDPSAPPWAIALAARLEEEGTARGRGRQGSESVVRYGRELAGGALPDPRLAVVAEVVSDALFSGVDPGPTTEQWATSTFDDILERHPRPSKRPGRRASEPTPV